MSGVFHIGQSHWLEQAPDGVTFDVAKDKVPGRHIIPRVIVIHYGVTRTHNELVRALTLNDYVSAHWSVSGRKEQRVTQHLPCNIQGAHAGATAKWRGQTGVNGLSLGIEINNPGPLFETADGWADIRGKAWDGEVLVAPHPSGNFHKWTAWAVYPPQEIAIVTALCLAAVERYPTIEDIVGHDEIRTDKADPGPAFPVGELRRLVFPPMQAA